MLSVIFSLSFFAGCSSEKIAGTSEETNEMAYQESSSSKVKSSSSSNGSKLGEKSSSSVKSSSSFGESKYGEKSSSSRNVSSSSRTISSSSEKPGSSQSESSSSSVPESSSARVDVNVNSSSSGNPGKIENASSSSEKPNEGSTKPNTLDYYLKLFNLESDSFDSGVLSTTIGQDKDGDPQNPNPPMVSEFDTPWPHKIVKQNVNALDEYFPIAFAMYPGIIDAIKNETLDENCGLYTFNVYGNGLFAAYIVAEVSENVIKVLDIPAHDCKAISSSEMSRFLFYYCGELNSHAETEHVTVDVDLSGKCPVVKTDSEWVSDKPLVPSKKNL
jgi:hypothetical protein